VRPVNLAAASAAFSELVTGPRALDDITYQ
jgi:hypothetical protein